MGHGQWTRLSIDPADQGSRRGGESEGTKNVARFVCWLFCHLSVAIIVNAGQAAPPSVAANADAEIEKLIALLDADQPSARDAALVELVQKGNAVAPALLQAAASANLETSWRAEEALRLVCRTIDVKAAAALRSQLIVIAKKKNAPEAAVAGRLVKFWRFFRHDYAAAQLEARGAQIADAPIHPQSLAEPATAVGVPGLGGIFMGGKARLVEPAVFEDLAVEVLAADEEAVKEEETPDDEKEIDKEEESKPADDDKEKPKGVGLRGLFKVLERAAVKVGKVGLAADEAIGKVFEKKMDRELRRLEAVFDGEAAADVEILEAAPAVKEVAPLVLEGFIAPGGFGGGGLAPWMVGGGGIASMPMWTYADGEMVVSASTNLSPGTLRIDESWRGSDRDLGFLAELQGIYTVILSSPTLTDAALAHLARLPSLQRLEVAGTKMTGAALVKLRHQRPSLTIVARGPAVLGLACVDHPQGVQARQVIAETGARRAGISEGDIITKVNGQRIVNFPEMVLALFDKRAGETVTVEYRRGASLLTCTVTLTDRAASGQGADTRMVQQQQPHFQQQWGGGVFFDGAMPCPAMMPAMGVDVGFWFPMIAE
jgi:hypothetical protein